VKPPLHVLTACMWVMWLVCAPALGQRGAGNVSGKVVSAQSGQGLRKVTVRLKGEGAEGTEEYEATTDAAGAFRIEGVPAGEYTVTVTRTGYFVASTAESAMQVTVEAGLEVAGTLYKMDAAGIVTGKITEADGDPVVGVSVTVLRRGEEGASEESRGEKEVGRGATNDLGEFRVANVPAGMYAIMAEPASGQGPTANAGDKTRGSKRAAYVITYYPGVPEEKQAGPVLVKAGETAAVNFGLLTKETYRVSGTVLGGASAAVSGIVLTSSSGSTLSAALDGAGQFEFPSVEPGRYEARLLLKSVGAAGGKPKYQNVRTPIEVSNEDMVDLQLQPETRGTVSGTFRRENEGNVDWSLMAVTLVPMTAVATAEAGAGADTVVTVEVPNPTALNEDGTFEVKDVAAGSYWIEMEAKSDLFRDDYVKSVMEDGRETVETGFAVNGGATLDVVMSGRGAVIEGTVVDEKGYPVVDAYVVTVPSGGKESRPGAYQRVQTKAKGVFELHGLNPGEYVVVALGMNPGDVRGAEFLQKAGEKGVKVRVEEGERKSVELVVERR